MLFVQIILGIFIVSIFAVGIYKAGYIEGRKVNLEIIRLLEGQKEMLNICLEKKK